MLPQVRISRGSYTPKLYVHLYVDIIGRLMLTRNRLPPAQRGGKGERKEGNKGGKGERKKRRNERTGKGKGKGKGKGDGKGRWERRTEMQTGGFGWSTLVELGNLRGWISEILGKRAWEMCTIYKKYSSLVPTLIKVLGVK